MILVTFAVPFESEAFRKCSVSHTVRIVHTGVGADHARAALEQALADEIPERVIASGFAGALVPDLAIGDIVSDRTRKIANATEVLATVADKQAFRARTGAEVVDMETEAIREICEIARVPFTVLRAISDGAEDDLGLPPDLLDALSAHPVRAMPRLVWTLVTNTKRRQSFLRLVRDCRVAQNALAEGLVAEIDATTNRG